VPSGHGAFIEDGESNIWIYLEATRMNSMEPDRAFEKALQQRLQGPQILNKFISLDNFI
jgi:spore germination protein GerM